VIVSAAWAFVEPQEPCHADLVVVGVVEDLRPFGDGRIATLTVALVLQGDAHGVVDVLLPSDDRNGEAPAPTPGERWSFALTATRRVLGHAWSRVDAVPADALRVAWTAWCAPPAVEARGVRP
jgi:hypothetical protein